MAFSFGFCTKDLLPVSQLAWKICDSYHAISKKYEPISIGLESLCCILEEVADTKLAAPLPPWKLARLNMIMDGCINVLADLQYIVQRYKGLTLEEKRSWDCLKMGPEDVVEIRKRLASNVVLLENFRDMTTIKPDREYGSWQWIVELSETKGFYSPSIAPPIPERSSYRSSSDGSSFVVSPSWSPPKSMSFNLYSSPKKRLISAIENKNINKALEILHDESSPDALDLDTLNRAIWSCALFPSTGLMGALLTKGADINTIRDKKSVLYNAVSSGNDDGVAFLLAHKVNLSIDHLHPTFIPLRAALRFPSAMALLARHPCAPLDTEYSVSSTLQLSILHEAVFQAREPIVRILLDAGAKTDTCSSTHGTALMIALSIGAESISKLLIQRGANVNFTHPTFKPNPATCAYKTPVQAALLSRKPQLLKLLFQAGAVANVPQALKFAQARSEYPLIPAGASSQYGGRGAESDGAHLGPEGSSVCGVFPER